MAERKSGPVKPPVIDLTARPAESPPPTGATPAAGTSPAADAAKPTGPDKPEASPPPAPAAAAKAASATGRPVDNKAALPKAPAPAGAKAWGPALAGGVGGAVIAVAVCYGLATVGLWPAAGDPRVTALDTRLGQSEAAATTAATALAALGTRFDGLQSDVTGKLAAVSSGLDDAKAGLAKAETAKPPAVDLAPLESQVKTLSARVDAVAAGASSADAGALAANIATVQQNLNDLSGKLAALDGRAATTDTSLAGLKTELDSAKSAIDQAAAAPSPKTIASAMQLPLLISALESDFGAGRPYDGDLQSLKAALPEARVPASVSDAAASGLPAADELARAFEAAMPDMLAARPAGTDVSWQGQVGDWIRNALAFRQQGEIAGDSPEAVLSRLEAAVNRHDFATAATLLGQLPPPVQQAAGDLGSKIRTLAEADGFVATLRKTALAPAGGAAQ